MHSHYIHTHEAKTNRDRKEMKKLILGAVDTGSVSIFSANHHKTHTHTHTHTLIVLTFVSAALLVRVT